MSQAVIGQMRRTRRFRVWTFGLRNSLVFKPAKAGESIKSGGERSGIPGSAFEEKS